MSINTLKRFSHTQSVTELWPYFKAISTRVELKKGNCVGSELNGVMGFVQSGLLINQFEHNAKLITVDFFKENDGFCDLAFTNIKSIDNYKLLCLEDCIVDIISRETYDTLLEQQPDLNNVGRMVFEHFYINLKRRLVAGYGQSPTQQYLKLIEKSPLLVERLPKKYLASYLNISPEALSRIRRKTKKDKND